ncbi:MAG: shikimate dehydrogenase [Pelagibacteraceae bacterium TMED232]|nr:MAG: shikimate dehydrogenase [Pelagibacteraceae bacterium TMED232]
MMNKYLVVGNPIEHSMSPLIHNYWIKKNNIRAIYDKKKLNSVDLKDLIIKIREKNISGVNVTVPFKKEVIPYLDKLTLDAETTQSVNTILLTNDNKIVGHNTDIGGFENAIKDTGYNLSGKKILILGSGGVTASIIFALYKMEVSSITITNRTKTKAEYLQNFYNSITVKKNGWNKIKVVEWGQMPEFDMIINATSVGLNNNENLNLDFSKIGKNKFFYDVIYNPKETNFLKKGKDLGNKTENGKKMFIFQAAEAFKIWHDVRPEINEEVNILLD